MLANLNVYLIGRFYNEMWNHFDKSLFPELLAKDIRFRGSLGQSAVGYGEFGQYVDTIRNAFPDFTNLLHTQTWSYRAIAIYLKAGFEFVRQGSFGGYPNDYLQAMPVLRTVLPSLVH